MLEASPFPAAADRLLGKAGRQPQKLSSAATDLLVRTDSAKPVGDSGEQILPRLGSAPACAPVALLALGDVVTVSSQHLGVSFQGHGFSRAEFALLGFSRRFFSVSLGKLAEPAARSGYLLYREVTSPTPQCNLINKEDKGLFGYSFTGLFTLYFRLGLQGYCRLHKCFPGIEPCWYFEPVTNKQIFKHYPLVCALHWSWERVKVVFETEQLRVFVCELV